MIWYDMIWYDMIWHDKCSKEDRLLSLWDLWRLTVPIFPIVPLSCWWGPIKSLQIYHIWLQKLSVMSGVLLLLLFAAAWLDSVFCSDWSLLLSLPANFGAISKWLTRADALTTPDTPTATVNIVTARPLPQPTYPASNKKMAAPRKPAMYW